MYSRRPYSAVPYSSFRQPATGSTPTNITLGQASWLWTGRAPNADAKTMIALAQGTWTWTGRAASVNAQTGITLARAMWQWFGIPLQGSAVAFQNLMLFFGIGS